MSVKMSGLGQIEARFRKHSLVERFGEAVEDAVNDGIVEMAKVVQTSGTNKEWSRPWPKTRKTGGGPARIDTGEMIDSIESHYEQVGRNRVKGSFGWLDGSPAWWVHQEYGFTHNLTGEFIKGMNALKTAEAIITPKLEAKMDKIVERFTRGRL